MKATYTLILNLIAKMGKGKNGRIDMEKYDSGKIKWESKDFYIAQIIFLCNEQSLEKKELLSVGRGRH